MGGLSWFAIPWLCATTMGLAALALENNPVFPTYPLRMATADVTAGLVLPNAAVALLGSGGAAATLLLIFMAGESNQRKPRSNLPNLPAYQVPSVTSAMSAELIAVSSIWTYDIYQTYINPGASGRRLIYMSHSSCVIYALVMAGFSTGLYYAGISMGYLYLMMGVIISGAVIPASLSLLWDRQSWAAATFSPPLALACSLIAWLVTAKTNCGALSVDCTGSNYPMLAGNVAALLAPIVTVPVLSLIFPSAKYDWVSMKMIRRGDDSELAAAAHIDLELVPGESRQSDHEARLEEHQLQRASKIARTLTVVLTLALLILWPMPMYGSGYIFSRKFFTGWIVVGILWLFISAACVGIYPLYEGRTTMVRTAKAIWKDVTGRGGPITHGRATVAETADLEEKREEEEKKAKEGGEKEAVEGESP